MMTVNGVKYVNAAKTHGILVKIVINYVKGVNVKMKARIKHFILGRKKCEEKTGVLSKDHEKLISLLRRCVIVKKIVKNIDSS